jgi:hypothetical protein
LNGATLGGALFSASGFHHASTLAGVLAFAAVFVSVAAALSFACVDTKARDGSGFFRCGWRGGFVRCFAATCRSKEAGGGDCSDGSGANWIFHCEDLYDESEKRYGFRRLFWSIFRLLQRRHSVEYPTRGAICPISGASHVHIHAALRPEDQQRLTLIQA